MVLCTSRVVVPCLCLSFQRIKELEEEYEMLQEKLQALRESTVSEMASVVYSYAHGASPKRTLSVYISFIVF